ncbi:MAG TPA: mechanosensitive ion channel domain-containing protein [Candidatus Acidoferrum sp.]|jgi:small-conductance mechanosensitive channel|nr:mechanosensitive ion channel domain-containing protein [Candidatus Acidoferrum sp.]
MYALLRSWETWLWSAAILAGAVLFALLVRVLFFALLRRFSKRAPTLLTDSLVLHSERHSVWILPLLAVIIALPAAPLPALFKAVLQHFTGIALIASIAWLVMLFADVCLDILSARYRVDVADNLVARKIQTQLRVLRRLIAIVIIVVALALVLMTFPSIHQIGTSLLASAGLAGLVIGMAMKSTLSGLIAGIQIAITQPIRIDDVVVVEGEWGWIEEIETTYVVVRIWDLRRLVLPLTYFIEHPFQNWTRTSADLLAYVLLWVDFTTPVDELREELTRILNSTRDWKGKVNVLQVVDSNEQAMQIRALMDASDSSVSWNLRCYVREKLILFLQQRHPQSLPRLRADLLAPNGSSRPSGPHVAFAPIAPTAAPK